MRNFKDFIPSIIEMTVGIVIIIFMPESLYWGILFLVIGVITILFVLNRLYKFNLMIKNYMSKKKKRHSNILGTSKQESDIHKINSADVYSSGQVIRKYDSLEEHDVIPLIVKVKNRIYENGQIRVLLESNKKSATIYYSIDKGEFHVCQDSIIVNHNCTICVYAELNDKQSDKLFENIDDFQVDTPIINVSNRTISILSDTKDCDIYFTLDGMEPSKAANIYQSSFVINKSCIIKAIATKYKWRDSEIVSQQVNIPPTKEERVRKFTNETNIIGLSYKGDSHIKSNSSCQDYHHFEKINSEWSIAIVSDGAGSAKHSDEGSRAVCAAFTFYIKQLIEKDNTLQSGQVLDNKTWDIEFKGMLANFQSDLKKNLVRNDMPFESFAATIILLVYSSHGYMVAHVGDGRAGVKVNGEWYSIISPHKGDEANQTIFSTSKYFGEKYIPNLKMSNVYVPETNTSHQKIEAFVLMSDGCENGAWMTYQRKNLPNGDFRVEDVNLPRSSSLEQCLQILELSSEKRKTALIEFITESSNAFVNEPDDKTILISKV